MGKTKTISVNGVSVTFQTPPNVEEVARNIAEASLGKGFETIKEILENQKTKFTFKNKNKVQFGNLSAEEFIYSTVTHDPSIQSYVNQFDGTIDRFFTFGNDVKLSEVKDAVIQHYSTGLEHKVESEGDSKHCYMLTISFSKKSDRIFMARGDEPDNGEYYVDKCSLTLNFNKNTNEWKIDLFVVDQILTI